MHMYSQTLPLFKCIPVVIVTWLYIRHDGHLIQMYSNYAIIMIHTWQRISATMHKCYDLSSCTYTNIGSLKRRLYILCQDLATISYAFGVWATIHRMQMHGIWLVTDHAFVHVYKCIYSVPNIIHCDTAHTRHDTIQLSTSLTWVYMCDSIHVHV